MSGSGRADTTTSPAPELCEGFIAHHRLNPRRHAFRHRVFYLRVPLSRLAAIENRWLRRDGFNLLSFHARDYGPRDGSDLLAWVQATLAAEGFPVTAHEVVLQTFPRVLGYVFNPLSLWSVFDGDGALRAVLCEVNNTFGERHVYLVAHADARPIGSDDVLTARKVLHVSPFCEVAGHYRFRFAARAGRWTTAIDYHAGGAGSPRVLATLITGVPQPLNAGTTLAAFARHPLFTFGVVALIHWHALRLWAKRVPWFRKPLPPNRSTSSAWSAHVAD